MCEYSFLQNTYIGPRIVMLSVRHVILCMYCMYIPGHRKFTHHNAMPTISSLIGDLESCNYTDMRAYKLRVQND